MNKEKYVDESWKEQASEEKDKLDDAAQQTPDSGTAGESHGNNCGCGDHTHEVEINFLNYITSLGFQAMIFMGDIPNPVTNEVEKNLMQAKFLIDTLSMLKEKTVGNLNDQEKGLLESSVYELQMRYIQHMKDESTPDTGKTA